MILELKTVFSFPNCNFYAGWPFNEQTPAMQLNMKKKLIIFFLLLLYAPVVFADAVDDGLPPATAAQLKAGTRQMIHLGMKTSDAIRFTRAMVQHHFSVEQALKAQQIVMKAQHQALPVDPIAGKAFEGMAKNVKADRIVQAMNKVQARFAYAYSRAALLANQKAKANRLGNMLAAALAAGLNQQDAEKICLSIHQQTENMSRAQKNNLALEALKATREMARLGVTSKAVTGVVTQALQRGYSVSELKSMRQSFVSRSRSTSPQDLARSYSEALGRGKSIHGPGGSGDMGGGSGDMGGSSGDMGGGSGDMGGSSGDMGGGSGDMGGGSGSGGGGPGGGGPGASH